MMKYTRGEIVALISTDRIHYQGRPSEERERVQIVEVTSISRDRSTIRRVRTHPKVCDIALDNLYPRTKEILCIGGAPCPTMPEGTGAQPGARKLFREAEIGALTYGSKDEAREAVKGAYTSII